MSFSQKIFDQMPIVGILRGFSEEEILKSLEIYKAAGLTTAEITMNTPNAKLLIQKATKQFAGQLNIGAGTVCTMSDLEDALQGGAEFIVTPVLDENVIRACVKAKVPIFPGAYTPSEIYKAWSLGASMVKVFPANLLGPKYIKAILAPLDDLKLIPTGGVNFDNIGDYLKAGAKGFGMGSLLFDKALIKSKNWEGLEEKLRGVANKYKEVRGELKK